MCSRDIEHGMYRSVMRTILRCFRLGAAVSRVQVLKSRLTVDSVIEYFGQVRVFLGLRSKIRGKTDKLCEWRLP